MHRYKLKNIGVLIFIYFWPSRMAHFAQILINISFFNHSKTTSSNFLNFLMNVTCHQDKQCATFHSIHLVRPVWQNMYRNFQNTYCAMKYPIKMPSKEISIFLNKMKLIIHIKIPLRKLEIFSWFKFINNLFMKNHLMTLFILEWVNV